jgi:predicted  nucleic acid-binding Zn-ribbon protein
LSQSIAELRAEQERLEEAKASGATIVSLEGGISTRLQQIEQELNKTRQDLQNTEGELNDLNQKFPP